MEQPKKRLMISIGDYVVILTSSVKLVWYLLSIILPFVTNLTVLEKFQNNKINPVSSIIIN